MNPPGKFRVFILGASGQFGRRLGQRLAKETHLTLILCGRDKTKLIELQQNLQNSGKANIEIASHDIEDGDFSALLSAYRPHIVIHLAGPFQNQGYKVAKACLLAHVTYIDMADGRSFVENFHFLDAEAKEKGVSLITGASTVPALSSAVIDKIQKDIPELYEIDYGICAGLRTGLGYATLKAVLSYCGKPYTILGKPKEVAYGLSEPRRHSFILPVGQRLIVNCDIPDHSLFPTRYPTLIKLGFGSCIDVPGLAHILSMMSWIVQRKWIKDWHFLSPLILPFMNTIKFLGSPHSGFFTRALGMKDGESKDILFEIIALNGSGLEIPVTPVVLLLKKIMKGEKLQIGAYPCVGLFSLDEFEQELSSFPISFHWKTIL